jgi:hypothetical protein
MANNGLRIAVLVLVIAFIVLFYYSGTQQQYYQATAEPVVATILGDVSSWEIQAMRQHLSTAADQTIDDNQLKQLLDQYRPLGQLVAVDTLQFSRLMSVFSLLGDTRISYSGSARFEHGPADFTLTLEESGGVFSIYNLTIQPLQN